MTYPPPIYQETDEAALEARVNAAPFAVICVSDGDRPLAVHAPVLLEGRRLRFHLSANNPVALLLKDGDRVLTVVTGPNAYISPDWYGQDHQVGTWNYLSAQLEGPVRRLGVEDATILLDDLSDRFERDLLPKPMWQRTKMSPDRFDSLVRMIVAFEVTVERLDGVTKLGQNKKPEARNAVADALEKVGEHEISGLMRQL